jgi:hypothetical protein
VLCTPDYQYTPNLSAFIATAGGSARIAFAMLRS